MKYISIFILFISAHSNAQTFANSVKSGNFNDATVWDVAGNVNFGVNIQDGHIVNIPAGFIFTNPKVNFIRTGKLNFESSTSKWVHAPDGLISANAASSAAEIKKYYPNSTDGIYYINLPIVGTQQVYCLMDSKYDGGGWMLAMKAKQGNTFSYSSSYWTTNNKLNENIINILDGDAKYDVMNYFQGLELLALWPDISIPISSSATENGSIDNIGVWNWEEKNFNGTNRTTMINFFSNVSRKSIIAATSFSGYNSSLFTMESGYNFYGFNYTNSSNAARNVRWGFGWNNENDENSNDSGGGIGMNDKDMDDGVLTGGYSAGDARYWNGITPNGIHRAARVLVYIR